MKILEQSQLKDFLTRYKTDYIFLKSGVPRQVIYNLLHDVTKGLSAKYFQKMFIFVESEKKDLNDNY